VKQCVDPVIRPHLLRGAFYLTLLVAVCVIPFAHGQRATTKQSAVAEPARFRIEATRDIVYRRRSRERDLDCHGQPKHSTLCSHGHLAAQRHGPCCRGNR
jgi:hypothetical protein